MSSETLETNNKIGDVLLKKTKSPLQEFLTAFCVSFLMAVVVIGVIIGSVYYSGKINFYNSNIKVSDGFYCQKTNSGNISGICNVDYNARFKFGSFVRGYYNPEVIKTFDDNGILYAQIQYLASENSGPNDVPNTMKTIVIKVDDLGKALSSENTRRALYDLNDNTISPSDYLPVTGFDKVTLKPLYK